MLAALICPLIAAELPPVLAIGAKASNLNLPGTDGKPHALKDFAEAKVLVVIFTSNHCPEARAAAPRMAEFDAKYRSKGVAFVAIGGNHPDALRPDGLGYSPFGDSFEEMKPFAEENGWKFPYLYDGETQKVTTAYGAQATPHVYVFDDQRLLRYNGRMDDTGRSTNNYLLEGNPDDLAEVLDPKWGGALPLTLLVEPGGQIIWRSNDEIEALTLRRELIKWLDEKQVP